MTRSFVHLLIGGAVLVAVLFFAVRSYLTVIEDVTAFKHEQIGQRFSMSMDYAHRQWLIQGKPNKLFLQYFADEQALNKQVGKKLVLQMSQSGWPINIDSEDKTLDCLALWMYFAHQQESQVPTLDLTTQLAVKQGSGYCHFLYKNKVPNQLMFSYNSNNGQVVDSFN